MIVVGIALRSRIYLPVWLAYGPAVVAPFLPTAYVEALPYYELDSYPVLHDPLLRPAQGETGPRVCYVYGIAFGSLRVQTTPETKRTCVDLELTDVARTLTTAYDQGLTGYSLKLLGDRLTEDGLPVDRGPTGVPGLVVTRAYPLSDREARVGATPVN